MTGSSKPPKDVPANVPTEEAPNDAPTEDEQGESEQ